MDTDVNHAYISADSHVVEPADLWLTRMDKRFRDRAPHTVSQPEGDFFCSDGLPPAAIAGFFGAMVNDKMTGSGEVSSPLRRNAEIRPGAWDPMARLTDQDLDNVCAEVLYPGTAIFLVALPDTEYQRECFRVYNDWISEFCRAVPQRLIGTALLPFGGPIDWTIAEAERVAKLGIHTVIVPHDIPYHDRQYQPLWAALQDLDMLVAMHPGGTSKPPFEQFGSTPALAWVTQNKQGTMLQGLSGLLASAVPQNYPKLRFVIVEGGIGWMAATLRFMDHWWEDNHRWLQPHLDEKPSAYFHRQFWATFEDDRAGLLTRHLLNVDHLMWGSDYPHTEGTFPRSQQQIAQDFSDLPAVEVRKIVVENAAKLYGLTV